MSEENVFKQELDNNELEEVAGGRGTAAGHGRCRGAYYRTACDMEVAKGTNCIVIDYCEHVFESYDCNGVPNADAKCLMDQHKCVVAGE